MRTVLLLLLVSLAALADEPTAPPAPAAEAPATAAAPASATAAQAAASAAAPAKPTVIVSADTAKMARSLGLQPRMRQGELKWCIDEPKIGTRFTSETCVVSAELEEVVHQRAAAREQLRRSGACPNNACGSK